MDNRDIDSKLEENIDVDNLISDDLKPPKNRLHTILTIIALFIIVLMSTIIATKIILDDSQNDESVLQDPDSLRDPDLIIDETKKKETNQTLKPETKSIYDIASYDEVAIESIDSEEATSIMDVEESNGVKSADKSAKTTATVENKPKERPIEKPTPKPTPKPKPKVHTVPATSNGRYYIQVGSFVEAPGKRFLKIISSNGFRYEIRQKGANKQLLIGGYETRSQASKALIDVKDKINKNAFITR
ncbi:MAG: SPOR domain-containing protein [Campylobacterota bacterium]|nr:SPOR domain-containing protein [Campylobacterota bacterium]